jgi:type IV pilus assembly protein PilO
MEALQLLVQPSDLALTALAAKGDAKAPNAMEKPSTQLKLRLSFFDRVAKPEAKAASSQRRP